MIYRTTLRADADIIDLFAQGAARYGVSHAENYLQGLIAVFGLLAANPLMARERAEFDPPVRLHPYRAHLIVYKERRDELLIIRVLHGREDWRRHLA